MSNEVTVTKDLSHSKLVIEREFDAQQENVWKAFAEKSLFEKWWGPEGWETNAKEFSFFPGGRVHYEMKCIDENQSDWYGKSSWGVMVIDSTDEPNGFSYTDYFSDETGDLSQDMPALKITNEFYTIDDGRTRFVSRSEASSAEQIEQIVNMGAVEGFTSQLKKLDNVLNT